MLKSKIQSGTITETKPVHFALFDAAREACGAGEEGEDEEEEGEEGRISAKAGPTGLYGVLKSLLSLLQRVFTSAPAQAVGARIKNVATAAIQNTIVRLIGAFALFVVVLGWISLLPSTTTNSQADGDIVTNEQMQALHERMDVLSGDMRQIKDVLQAILAELRSGQDGQDGRDEVAPLAGFVGDEL